MNYNFHKINQTVIKQILLLMLCFFLTFIGSFIYFIVLSRIGYAIASGLYINFWISLVIYSYFIINAVYAIILNFRGILVLFQKIRTVDHPIEQKDEPQLFEVVKEIVEELNLNYIPNIYIKEQIEIEIEHANQMVAIYNPKRFRLLIGLALFQCLTREEFKAYLKVELAKLAHPNAIKVQRYNAMIFSCYGMFLRIEDVDRQKLTWPKLSPRSFFFFAYSYYYLTETITIEIFKRLRANVQQLNQLLAEEEKNTYSPAYIQAIYKLDEYYRIHSYTKAFAIDHLHHQYNITNVYGFTQYVLHQQDFKAELLAEYNNYLEKTKIDASYFEDNIEKFLNIKAVKNQFQLPNDTPESKIFQLNSGYLYGFKTHQNEGELASYNVIFQRLKSFQKAKKLPFFFNELCKFITFDFEALKNTYQSDEIYLRKEGLFEQAKIKLVEDAHVLCRDLELLHSLKENHFKTIIYDQQVYTKEEINALLDDLIVQHHQNIEDIQAYLEELYIYFKTFQVDESKEIVLKLVDLKNSLAEAHELADEIHFLKDGIYTEANDKLVQQLIERFEEKFIPVKKSLGQHISDEILTELYTTEILETISTWLTSPIPLYEKGIYFQEGFETMMKLNTWNLVIQQDLIHLYTKKYFELNQNVYP